MENQKEIDEKSDIQKFTKKSLTIYPIGKEGFFEPTLDDLKSYFQAACIGLPEGDKKYPFDRSDSTKSLAWEGFNEGLLQYYLMSIMAETLHEAMIQVPKFGTFMDTLFPSDQELERDMYNKVELLAGWTKYKETDPRGEQYKEISWRFHLAKWDKKHPLDDQYQFTYSLETTFLTERDGTDHPGSSGSVHMHDLPYEVQGKLLELFSKLTSVPTLMHYFLDKYRAKARKFMEQETKAALA